MRLILLLVLCGVLVPAGNTAAQQLPAQEPLVPEDYDPEEFPLWARDLRRYEVISIGSFPITFLVGSLVYDFSVAAANGFAPEYGLGTQRANRDIGIIVSAAAGTSLLIATIDLIVTISRRRAAEGGSDEQ